MPYFDEAAGEEIDRLFKEKFDLLLGRKTYEIFAAYWPYYNEGAPAGGIAKLFKQIKKYVVSRSGEVDTGWAGSVLLRELTFCHEHMPQAERRWLKHNSTLEAKQWNVLSDLSPEHLSHAFAG